MSDIEKLIFYKTPGGEVRIFDPNAKTKRQRERVQKQIKKFAVNKLKIENEKGSRSRIQVEIDQLWKRKQDIKEAGRIIPAKKQRLLTKGKLYGKLIHIDPCLRISSVKQEYLNRKDKKYPVEKSIDSMHKTENKVADWLVDNFGGRIKVLEENHNNEFVKFVDLDWNKELWEIKTPSNPKRIQDRLENAFNKISRLENKHLDGIIINIEKEDKSKEKDILVNVYDRINRSCVQDMDIIIKHGDNLLDILRVKHKK